jgi:hypothetical protein
MISIHLNKHNIHYVKDCLDGTKLKILKFTRKTRFHGLITLYNFVVYNQSVIRNAKSIRESTC